MPYLKLSLSFPYAAPQIHDPRDLLPTEPIPQNLSNEAITEHSNETKIEANTTESITGDPNAGEPQVEQVQVAYIHDPNGANGQNTENTVHILDFGNDFSTANAIINEQNGIITVISEGQLQGQLQETNGGTTYEYIPLQTVNAGENGPQTRDPIQVHT